MLKRVWLVMVLCATWFGSAQAQNDVVFVQIEAKRSLAEAFASAQNYADRIPDLNGFQQGRNWYALTVGPYVRTDAERVLDVYRREGLIPRDSFIALPSDYGRQFWPVGADILRRGTLQPPQTSDIGERTVDAPSDPDPIIETPLQQDVTPDETPREARAREQLLSLDQRKELQIALQWSGVYDGAIDGLYGRGTRSSMTAWQTANGFEPTGILTSLQRTTLLDQYNAVLKDLGLRLVQDTTAGIEISLPMDVLGPAEYVTPFAQYDATDGSKARVVLISQEGDQNTLFGLYEILQTLEIVPLDGERNRQQSAFRIQGENSEILSDTQVSLQDGTIKGFILVWPVDRAEQFRRLRGEMEKSFARLPGVLSATAGLEEPQSIDLISGLEVRQPRLSRSGFFVDNKGTVLSTSEVVGNCTRLTLDTEIDAEVTEIDAASGVAILSPTDPITPLAFASFTNNAPRLKTEIAVAGYSYEGVLSGPTITYGTLSDLRGLAGETDIARLALEVLPGDVGGPVLDTAGNVLGMLLPRQDDARTLPADVNFSRDAGVLRTLLDRQGVSVSTGSKTAAQDPVDLADLAFGMTVLVSCWD